MTEAREDPMKRADILEVSDADLLRKASRGAEQAYRELVERHAPRLYRVALSLIGHAADAEDALQETFAGAFRHAGRYEGRASVKTWLTQILVRQAARRHRDRGRKTVGLGNVASSRPGEGSADARMDVDAAVQALSADHREVIVLREMQGLTYEEIAEALDVPRGTVESRLFRARQELKSRLKDYLRDE